MSLREINFSFDGKHCLRDFGCLYVAKKTRPVSPASSFQTYKVAGQSGTASFGDKRTHEVMRHTGTLYLMETTPTQAAAQEIYRRIGAWLKVGRRPLIWDYEPDRYLLAEVPAGVTFDESGWIDGGLAIEFQCQPFAYSLRPDGVRGQLTGSGTLALSLPLYTGEPAPVCCELENTGTAPIHSVTVEVGDKTVALSKGMQLLAGQTLTIDMEPPIGAAITTADGATNALPYAERFDYLVASGPVTGTVAVTFGSGDDQAANVRLFARGRWI